MAVLYRKYRPARFADVLGQEAIVQTLQNALSSGKFSHAYLFTGSRGIGKTSVARILAKGLNCLKLKDGEVCLTCQNCVAIAAGTFLDLIEIDAASNTGVDNIRELIDHAQFTPSQGKIKVFIVDEVHMLSRGAFNALLKTLEEPPSHVVFILATTEAHKVPATIISRSQRFDFKRLPETVVEKQFEAVLKQEKVTLAPEIIRLIALRSDGSSRDGLSLLDKVLSLGQTVEAAEAEKLLGITPVSVSQDLFALIIAKNQTGIPPFVSGLLENGVDFTILTRDVLEYLRKVLVYKVSGMEDPLLGQFEKEILQQQAESFQLTELMHTIRLFLKSYKDLSGSPSPELPLLLAALEAASKNAVQPQTPVVSSSQPKIASLSGPEKPKTSFAASAKTLERKSEFESDATLDETTVSEVTAFWPAVLDAVRAINSPLATLLKNSPLEKVEGGLLTLSVKYLFNKEHLESAKNYAVISQAIAQVSGKRLAVRVTLLKNQPSVPEHDVAALADALKVFGGELVD